MFHFIFLFDWNNFFPRAFYQNDFAYRIFLSLEAVYGGIALFVLLAFLLPDIIRWTGLLSKKMGTGTVAASGLIFIFCAGYLYEPGAWSIPAAILLILIILSGDAVRFSDKHTNDHALNTFISLGKAKSKSRRLILNKYLKHSSALIVLRNHISIIFVVLLMEFLLESASGISSVAKSIKAQWDPAFFILTVCIIIFCFSIIHLLLLGVVRRSPLRKAD